MWSIHARICGTYMPAYHICMHVYAWNVSKTDFNTKILLSSWIMHRFQRFLMFWKAECFLFHLETTFPHCFVFVRSKTCHLWKVCLIYWTNAGSSIHFGAGWRSLSSWVGRNSAIWHAPPHGKSFLPVSTCCWPKRIGIGQDLRYYSPHKRKT